jgi:ribosomal protein S18 acetylase RimI-like enzyme
MADLQFISNDLITLRPIAEADLPGLEWDGEYRHYRTVFRNTFEDAQRGERIMLVAVAGEQMVGQVFVQLHSLERRYADNQHRGYLYALRVKTAWQGLGVGTRLIAEAEDSLRARGFTIAVIAAAKDNPHARQLYERLGYRVFAEDPGVWYFSDENGDQRLSTEPCWVMEKNL